MKFQLLSFLLCLILLGCVAGTSGLAPYQPETVATITGVVDSFETVINKQTKEPGLHLFFNTVSEEYVVHVTPQWYADKTNIKFDKGEKLTITGSIFTIDFKQNIYAATITRSSGKVIEIRDRKTGESLWAGQNRDESLTDRDKTKQKKNEQEMKKSMEKSKQPSTTIRDGSKQGSHGSGTRNEMY